MRKILLLVSLAATLFVGCRNNEKPAKGADADFAKGADISWVTEMEKNGHKFYNAKGEETDCFALMKELGLNAVRLRVWVDPSAHGNWCNTEDLVVKAKRAHALGMDVMVDFHYSDYWADPGKQYKPASWVGLGLEELKAAFAKHTVDVLNAVKEAGVPVKWVQVGNEIRPGMMWDENEELSCASYEITGRGGKVYPMNWANLGAFFTLGYDCVKEVYPEAIVIVHLDNGYDGPMLNWFLDELKANGGKWDMVGLSLYPYWAKEKIDDPDVVISNCIENINTLSAKYDCDFMIVETGAECADNRGNLADAATLEEGKRQMTRVVRESLTKTNGRCKGVFYWEPQCRPRQYRLGAFTEDGHPTVIMDAFK